MRRLKHQVTNGEDLFVGIDLHKHRWHVTIRTFDVELFSASSQSSTTLASLSALLNTPDEITCGPNLIREPRIGDWLGFYPDIDTPGNLDFAHRSDKQSR
jgi:hypothetical protein